MSSRSHVLSLFLCCSHLWSTQAWLLPPEVRYAVAARQALVSLASFPTTAPGLISRDVRSDQVEGLQDELGEIEQELEAFEGHFSAFVNPATTSSIPSTASVYGGSSSSSLSPFASSSTAYHAAVSPQTPGIISESVATSIQPTTAGGRINAVALFNSNISPQGTLQDLASLCNSPHIDIINLGYITSFFDLDTHHPSLAFGVGCNTVNTLDQSFGGTELPDCTALGTHILTCQRSGKKVMASLKVQSSDTGFISDDQAQNAASVLWRLLGGARTAHANIRPLGYGPDGTAITLDGFEYSLSEDLAPASYINGYTQAFFNSLNNYFSADSTRSYLLSVSLPEDAVSGLSAMALQLTAWVNVRLSASDLQKRSSFDLLDLIRSLKQDLDSGGNSVQSLPAVGATVASPTTMVASSTTRSDSVFVTKTPIATSSQITASIVSTSALSSPASSLTPPSSNTSTSSAPMLPPNNALFPGNTFVSAKTSLSVSPLLSATASSPMSTSSSVASVTNLISSSASPTANATSSSQPQIATVSAHSAPAPQTEEPDTSEDQGSDDQPPDSGTSFSVIDPADSQTTAPPTSSSPSSSSITDTTVLQTVQVIPVPAAPSPADDSMRRKRQAAQPQSGPLLFVQISVGSSQSVDSVGLTLSEAASERLIGGVEVAATAQEIQAASVFGGVLVPIHRT